MASTTDSQKNAVLLLGDTHTTRSDLMQGTFSQPITWVESKFKEHLEATIHLSTKYYQTDIQLLSHNSAFQPGSIDQSFYDSYQLALSVFSRHVDAIVLCYKEDSNDQLRNLYQHFLEQFLEECDANVRVIVTNNLDSLHPSWNMWTVDNMFEIIELQYENENDEPGGPFGEKYGLPRLKEAIESNIWNLSPEISAQLKGEDDEEEDDEELEGRVTTSAAPLNANDISIQLANLPPDVIRSMELLMASMRMNDDTLNSSQTGNPAVNSIDDHDTFIDPFDSFTQLASLKSQLSQLADEDRRNAAALIATKFSDMIGDFDDDAEEGELF